MTKVLSYRIVAVAGLPVVILHAITYRKSPIRREFDFDYSDPILVVLLATEIVLLFTIVAVALLASHKRDDKK